MITGVKGYCFVMSHSSANTRNRTRGLQIFLQERNAQRLRRGVKYEEIYLCDFEDWPALECALSSEAIL